MANTDNVVSARANYTAGAIRTAPTTTTQAPSDASTALGNDWKDWGFVTDAGFVRTIERNSTKVNDMNGDPILVVQESHSLKYKFRPAEINVEALKAVLGDANVTTDTTTGALTGYKISSKELTPRSYCFNLSLSDGDIMRIYVPKGVIESVGDETLKPNEIMSSEITIEAMADASGFKAYVWFATPSGNSANNVVDED